MLISTFQLDILLQEQAKQYYFLSFFFFYFIFLNKSNQKKKKKFLQVDHKLDLRLNIDFKLII